MSLYISLEEESLDKARLKMLQLSNVKVVSGGVGSGASYIGLIRSEHKHKSFDMRKKKPYYVRSRW